MRRFLCCLASCVVLAGCGGGSTSPSVPGSSGGGSLTGSQGGTYSLPNGDSVTFPAQALLGTEKVTLSADPAETPSLPIPGWSAAPGTMTLTFGSPAGSKLGGSQGVPMVTMTFAYAKADATQILAAQAPILEITAADGTVQRISPDATFDAAKGQLNVSFVASLLSGATSAKLYAAIDGKGLTTYPLGPKLWNSATGQWDPEPFTVDPTKKTVVMVHGIFSAVETAFPCEQAIIDAGKYQQAIGLDYDWTQPPATEAPILAKLVNSLPVSSVDLEAHSYGTVVTLAALPQLTEKVDHVVLLGGPLPLNGAPQADPGYWRDLLMLGVWLAYPSEVYDAYHSGMISAMASNSPQMQAINNGLNAIALPPFVQVAGGSPLPQETKSTLVYLLYQYLYDGVVNDGIVEQKSAIQKFNTQTSEITFLDDDHIQLECDPQVQQFVGPLVGSGSDLRKAF